jgi:N-acetylglucosaminyldiphosphoundecaprenol N-acetyl-beta-D-mannosaminyltransferase
MTIVPEEKAMAALASTNGASIKSFPILGTAISAVSMNQTLSLLGNWVNDGRQHYVIFRDVHGLMCARTDRKLQDAQREFDLVLPDGVPLVWIMKWAGISDVSRVCGIDLLPAVCGYGVRHGWRHYFYGGNPGAAEVLAKKFAEKFPGIRIVGIKTPPFRPLTQKEDNADCAEIRAALPHFLWVCLGTPKQDLWMHEHLGKCGNVIMLGVGGAFDINAGLTARAPQWMQSFGLEWAYRLTREPARLWKRYFTHIPSFVVLAGLEWLTSRIVSKRNQ